MKTSIISMVAVVLLAPAVWAGEADVIEVATSYMGDDTFSFAVTVQHTDEGWGHYVNRWEILAPDGSVLGTRVLAHPHDEEQPFTRSLSGVKIPSGITLIVVRAHDSVHGHGGKSVTVQLPPRD